MPFIDELLDDAVGGAVVAPLARVGTTAAVNGTTTTAMTWRRRPVDAAAMSRAAGVGSCSPGGNERQDGEPDQGDDGAVVRVRARAGQDLSESLLR